MVGDIKSTFWLFAAKNEQYILVFRTIYQGFVKAIHRLWITLKGRVAKRSTECRTRFLLRHDEPNEKGSSPQTPHLLIIIKSVKKY